MNDSQAWGFIFDMDGLLFDSESLYQESRALAAEDFGFTIDRDFYFQALAGKHLTDCEDILRNKAGNDFDLTLFTQRCMHYVRELTREQGFKLKPGVREFLEFVRVRGACAVASGSNSDHIVTCLKAADIHQHFDLLVGRDQVSEGKPSPELFETAAARLEVAPSRCLVFEDSNTGVLASARGNMRVVMIPDIQNPDDFSQEHALAILPSIELAKPVVESVLSME